MKITILNGNPASSNTGFDGYLADLSEKLTNTNNAVTTFTLREMNIRYCVGCFGCWVRTPGECSAAQDDSVQVRQSIISSDLMILASPIIMGFVSAHLKKMQDKMLPLLMPYVDIFHGEQHHVKRYDRYPLMGLIFEPEADTDNEDMSIINEMYERNSLNFHSRIAFSHMISDSAEEVAHEINSL